MNLKPIEKLYFCIFSFSAQEVKLYQRWVAQVAKIEWFKLFSFDFE